MVWLDKTGYPVEFIQGRTITNFFRWLIYTSFFKSIRQRGRWQPIKGYGLTDTWCIFDNSTENEEEK